MKPLRIGVVSDTHGLLRPEALDALRGSDLIVHAGDVGSADVIARLESIAPVHAVRGNVDGGGPCSGLPETRVVEAGDSRLFVLHNLDELRETATSFDAIISGHSHRPLAERRGGVLYLNPGSIGPRRFTLPVSMARLEVRGAELSFELIELDV